MTSDQAMTALVGATVGFATARILIPVRLKAPPQRLMRTNWAGRRVPAVLGGLQAIGAVMGLAAVTLLAASGWEPADTDAIGASVAIVVSVMTIAGGWDDLRGDEAPRGFQAHLRAARGGRVTGGIVKLVAGGTAGLAAGLLLGEGVAILEVALLVALAANFVNLTDRAPGRAGKISLLMFLPIALFGSGVWAVAAAGMVGALIACLVADLAETAMLGDAGANPLGAVVGLGLALSFERPGRIAAIVILAALNLVSERVSYSMVIERTSFLRAFDRLGRK